MPNMATADYLDCPVLHSADEQELIAVLIYDCRYIVFIFARQIAHTIIVSIYRNFSKLLYASSQYITENSSYFHVCSIRVF